ncbi:S-layer homology domain-containing protein, partial [Candidatus Peregrinibacteria bacterium]|nr:S-layer homology domain-containing protein [Candidatus Peregrinibacteria bacterium]
MKNFLRNGIAKKLVLFAFVMGMVSTSAMAAYQVSPVGTISQTGYQVTNPVVSTETVAAVAPVVSNLSVTPSTGSATVSFSINTTAYTTVWIKDMSDTIVKTLVFDNNLSAGSYSYNWNGTDNNNASVASGNYKAQVAVYNTASQDAKSYTFNFTSNGGGGTTTAPVVSVSVNPTSFDPTKGQSTTVSYSLNTTASLGAYVKLNGSIIKTLRAQTTQEPGSYTLSWNGVNDSSVTMGPNNYVVEVSAVNTAGNDSETATVTIVNDSNPSVTAPNITNLYASPTPFNPNNENTRVYFTVDKSSTVSVTIMDGSSTVRTLTSNASLSAGTYYYEWNGRNSSGGLVSDKVYTARVTASNSAGTDTENTSVEVDTDGGNGGSCEIVTSHYANPTTFDPSERDVQITYTISRSANVTVRIKKTATTIRTLVDNQSLSSGTRTISWNGKDSNGNTVSTGSYIYEIRATASGCSENVESSNVYVDTENGGGYEDDWPSTNEDLIRNLTVSPEIFQPRDGERATVRFNLSRAAKLRVQILDGTRIVKSLRDTGSSNQSSGDYSYTWDGRDTNGNIAPDKVYQVRVMADDGRDTDTDRAFVELDTDGIIIGFPDGMRCAGFKDVSIYSPFCKAIELMSKKHIFDGYSDGTFRPYERINRAETAKVVVLAL